MRLINSLTPILVSGFLVGAMTNWSFAAEPEDSASWQLRLHTGPYQPLVSDNSEARAHYEAMFASGAEDTLFTNEPMMTGLAFTWYPYVPLNLLGTLGLGASFSSWKVNGYAYVCTSDNADVPCQQRTDGQLNFLDPNKRSNGNSETQLAVVPFTLDLSYRFDYLYQAWDVPLLPYTQIGVNYLAWWARTNGNVSTYTTEVDGQSVTTTGEGGSRGVHGTLGLALSLSPLEPEVAARGRTTSGMADSFIFFEATRWWVDDFGSSTKLNLSATQFKMGLAIDFL